MRSPLILILQFLNQYANLLLVAVTAVYVFYTERTLEALKRANRKDLELRHLEDIKSTVADPVLAWLEGVVVALGGRPWGNKALLWIGTEPVAKQDAPLEEFPYDYPWRIRPDPTLWEPGATEVSGSANRTGGVSHTTIFSDARKRHFRSQLSECEAFLKAWQTFLSDLATFTTVSATSLQNAAGLPHVPANGPSPEEFANADYLVESCVRQIIRGVPIHFEFPPTGPQSEFVSVSERSISGRNIARVRDAHRVKAWVELSSQYVKEQWEKERFSDRVHRLLDETLNVRSAIEGMKLTHFLPGDCVYVGGHNKWALPENWRLWR